MVDSTVDWNGKSILFRFLPGLPPPPPHPLLLDGWGWEDDLPESEMLMDDPLMSTLDEILASSLRGQKREAVGEISGNVSKKQKGESSSEVGVPQKAKSLGGATTACRRSARSPRRRLAKAWAVPMPASANTRTVVLVLCGYVHVQKSRVQANGN
ncbi:hypothetical protein MN608_00489 [Microdochium nivale]|nr:hypothetical protein MN608_00489 [Microdochium nivale]